LTYTITFAHDAVEDELRGIFLDSDMDIAGDIQEHVLITKDDEIIGGGMMTQTGASVYHLVVFAVKESQRKYGIGRLLLKELLECPWQYCLHGVAATEDCYHVTTVSKGKSAGFYEKNGFLACDFSALAAPFCEQCQECPELSDCKPVAMMYTGITSQTGSNNPAEGNFL